MVTLEEVHVCPPNPANPANPAGSADAGGMPRLFLASRSPRRRQLLAEHGLEHEAAHPGLDDGELEPGRVSPAAWVASLAYLKAAAGAEALGARVVARGGLVLGADTTVVKDGQIIGQPKGVADAERILRLLSDGEHEVLTGVALLDPATRCRDVFVDRARVRVGRLSEAQLAAYLASGQWRGKAGAYNLRERLEAGWPIEHEGDPTSIMGLPMRALRARLERHAARRACGAVA